MRIKVLSIIILFLISFCQSRHTLASDISVEKDLQKSIQENRNVVPSFSQTPNLKVTESIKKERNVFNRLKDSINELIDTIEKGKDIKAEVSSMIKNIEEVEAEDVKIQKKFKDTEEKLRSLGSSKILLRHQEAFEKYKRKHIESIKYLNDIKKAISKKDREDIRQRAKDLIDFIDENKLKDEYDIKSTDNTLPWRIVEPGEILLLGDSTIMPQTGPPLVSTEPPTANDLSTTIDVQITPEIQQLAESLGNRPLEIYRYVYNNYDYTPYYGSMKGSLDTYWEKEGNNYDLATLLISLLRASNIPAKYVRAKIIIPADKVRKWTGINDSMAALQYLSSAKIPTAYYVKSGRISHVEIEHVYVEAYVPYSNYRGTTEDDTGKLWIPLDPSFKDYTVLQEGVDIASQMSFEWKLFSDEYLGELTNITPIEFYKNKIDQYIAENNPGQTAETLKRKTEISKMLFDFLPNTLPYMVSTINDRFSAIPQELRHSFKFIIPGTLDFSLSLPEVSGRRITLSFEGATADDQAVIDQYGGIFKTPPYLVEVKPILRVNGSEVAEGAPMNAGISTSFNVEYTQPRGEKNTFEHRIMTGSYNAVGITTGKVRPEFLSIGEVEASEEPYLSKMLHSLVMKYHNELNNTKQILNDTMKIKSKTFFTEALVSTHEQREVIIGGIPISFELDGFTIDAKEMGYAVMPIDGYDVKKVIDFAMVSGHEASYQENRVFEDNMFWLNGWSAVKGLQMLKAMDINVTELNPPMTYFNPNLPDTVVEDINNALNKGWKVIVPDDTGGLPVVPYIKYDPKTGSAGYMIASAAGGYSGYMEVDIQLLDIISYSITFPPLWRKPIGMDFEIVSPENSITVSAGDFFDLLIKMTVKWKESNGEEWTEVVSGPQSTMRIKTGPWTFIQSGPLPWWFPGHYNILYDGRTIFNFNIWGVRIESSSGKYIGISTDNGVDTISDPVKIKYSITDVQGVNLNSVKMTVRGSASTVRTVTLPNSPGDNLETSWDGKDDSGNIVSPGEYTIEIEAIGGGKTGVSNKHKVTVFKVVVTTPCESLAPPHSCTDSFIVNYNRTAESIAVNVNPGLVGVTDPVIWTCNDAPGGINSGTCNPQTGNSSSFSFIPNPPTAPNGRTGRLSYLINMSVTAGSQTATGTITIIQDELDQLRQQYHDMAKNRHPERNEFVNFQIYQNPGHFPFEEINSLGDITTWAIFTIAQNLENIRTDIGNQSMTVNSGYRTPRHNATMIPHSPESQHIYGIAADISSNLDYNGDGIVGNKADWEFLKSAAKNRGACVEPWDERLRVHMDWRGSCPDGW